MSKELKNRITREIKDENGKKIKVIYNEANASKIEEFMFRDDPKTGETTFRNGMVIENINEPQNGFEKEAIVELVIDGEIKDNKNNNKDNKDNKEKIDDER